MSSQLVLRLIFLALFVMMTTNMWLHVLWPVGYTADDESVELPRRTEEDSVISALRDAMVTPYKATSDCRRLFSKETSAYNFTMSGDFRANIAKFLSAVRASVAGATDVEGNSFQMETQYKFLQYLTSRLEFVRTVCETGMTATDVKGSLSTQPVCSWA